MATHRPRAHRDQPARRRLRLAVTGLVLTFAVVSAGVGAAQLWDRHEATAGTVTRLAPAAVGGQELDERRVPLEVCDVPAARPRFISIGAIDVKGCIQEVGLTGRQMQAPGNIHVAGWFTGSDLPGSKGLSIIDGHSSGRFKDGIFNDLGRLDTGERFSVEYGDGRVRRFEVTSVATHRIDDTMSRLKADASDQEASMALITCGGTYDAVRHSYDRRVVVLAVSV